MDALNINILDEAMKLAVDSWQDGAEYVIRVKQTATGQFDMVADETEPAEAEEATPEPAMPPKAPRPAKGENPAIAAVLAAGKGKKPATVSA